MSQISKSFHLSGGQSSLSSSSVGTRQSINKAANNISSSLRSAATQNTGKVTLQRRLFSGNTITQSSRAAIAVEGCSTLLSTLEGNADPNLPRGWDAGVMDDDDGG